MTPEQRAKRLYARWLPQAATSTGERLTVEVVAEAIRSAENAALERAAEVVTNACMAYTLMLRHTKPTPSEVAATIRSLKTRAPRARRAK